MVRTTVAKHWIIQLITFEYCGRSMMLGMHMFRERTQVLARRFTAFTARSRQVAHCCLNSPVRVYTMSRLPWPDYLGQTTLARLPCPDYLVQTTLSRLPCPDCLVTTVQVYSGSSRALSPGVDLAKIICLCFTEVVPRPGIIGMSCHLQIGSSLSVIQTHVPPKLKDQEIILRSCYIGR